MPIKINSGGFERIINEKYKKMETPYLDNAIERHEKALNINMLSDGGKEALIEFKAIKQALRIHDVVWLSEPCGLLHATDWNGKCFKCGEQVFVREPK